MHDRKSPPIIPGHDSPVSRSAICRERRGRWAVARPPTNSFAGHPSLLGIGYFFSLEICLLGQLDPLTGCLINIKEIDQTVRHAAIPIASAFVRRGRFGGGSLLLCKIYDLLKDAWPGSMLHHLRCI